MRHSLLAYMAGTKFDPKYDMTAAQLAELWKQPSALQQLSATITADNHHPNHAPEMAIDENPSTIWYTR